jgi:hypothetical protein
MEQTFYTELFTPPLHRQSKYSQMPGVIVCHYRIVFAGRYSSDWAIATIDISKLWLDNFTHNYVTLDSPDSHIDFTDLGVTFTSHSSFSFENESLIFGTESIESITTSTASVTDMTISTVTSLTFIDDSHQYTNAESFGGLTKGSSVSEMVSLTCSTVPSLSITYSLAQYGSYSVPSWITIDDVGSQIVGTIPDAGKTYKFYIQSSSNAWSPGIFKEITLTVLAWIWKVDNWKEWSDWYVGEIWKTWDANYEINEADQRTCIKKKISSTAQTASTATSITVAVSTSASIATSMLKASSPSGMWSLFNQLQMLILLLLIDTFVPVDVSDYIQQQSFAMMNFNFIPTQEIPYLNYPNELMDYKQDNEIMEGLGFQWRSTFNNLYSFLIAMAVIVFVHILVALSPSWKKKGGRDSGKIRSFCVKVRMKLLSFFMYSLYGRLLLEAHQSFLMSGVYEMNAFVTDTPAAIVSLSIAGVFVFLSLFLVVKAFHMLYKHWSDFDSNEDFFFMEYYADIRESKWARCYTSALLTRRLMFVIVILLWGFFGKDVILIILLTIQVIYTAQLLIIRPFLELENNIVEIVNEMFYCAFVGLMLYIDGEEMWTSEMTHLFLGLITLNSLVITAIMLGNLLLITIVFFFLALINCWIKLRRNNKTKKIIAEKIYKRTEKKVSTSIICALIYRSRKARKSSRKTTPWKKMILLILAKTITRATNQSTLSSETTMSERE